MWCERPAWRECLSSQPDTIAGNTRYRPCNSFLFRGLKGYRVFHTRRSGYIGNVVLPLELVVSDPRFTIPDPGPCPLDV